VKSGKLKGSETVKARITLTIDSLGVETHIDGNIKLS
jgi:hypothetical protein